MAARIRGILVFGVLLIVSGLSFASPKQEGEPAPAVAAPETATESVQEKPKPLVPPPHWRAPELNRLQLEYQAVKADVAAHSDGFFLDDAPGSPEMLYRMWSLIANWTAAYANTHHVTAAAQLEAGLKRFDPELEGEAAALSPTTYAVSVQQGEIGNLFVISSAPPAPFQAVWNISSAAAEGEGHELMAAWSALGAAGDCRPTLPEENWSRCGPLFGSVHRLPDDDAGHPRFYLDATYAQGAGCTVGAQLSFWQWDGQAAQLLLVRQYAYMIDQSVGTRLEADYLRVREKAFFRAFSSCGSCEERQMDWTFKVTPAAIEDLGEESMVPELDLVDELYSRLAHGLPVGDLAAPEVEELLRSDVAPDEDDSVRFGMLSDWKVKQEPSRTVLCFSTDDLGPRRFTIHSINGRLFAAAVEDFSDKPFEGDYCTQLLQ